METNEQTPQTFAPGVYNLFSDGHGAPAGVAQNPDGSTTVTLHDGATVEFPGAVEFVWCGDRSEWRKAQGFA